MAKILKLESREEKDEMVPVDEWDGECWKTFFDEFCVPCSKMHGCSPWDYLADFIQQVAGWKKGADNG